MYAWPKVTLLLYAEPSFRENKTYAERICPVVNQEERNENEQRT